MATITCTDLYTLCDQCIEARDKSDELFEEYVETIEQRFAIITKEPCYFCLGEATDLDCYEYLRGYCKQFCSHPDVDQNQIYHWDDLSVKMSWFVSAVNVSDEIVKMQMSEQNLVINAEANTVDQINVDHNVQPNGVLSAANVVDRSLTSIPPTMGNVFERQYLFQRGLLWTNLDAIGTAVTRFNVPDEIMTADLPFKGLIEYHGMIRCSVEVEVKVNTNPFICGQLLLVAVPRNYENKVGSTALNQSMELYPHSYLNAGYETNAKVLVPYASPHNAIVNANNSAVSTTHYENQDFTLYVWNQLQVATGQPISYSVSVWIRFVDIEFGIKMPTSATTKTVYQSREHAGLLSAIQAVGKYVSGASLPVISQVAKVAGGITGMWDSPLVAEESYTNVVCNVPHKGVDMRVIAENMSVTNTYDSLSLKDYMKTNGRTNVIAWTTSLVSGSELLSLSTTINQASSSGPIAGKYEIPLLEVSRHFRFWRGTLKFKIQVVATRFHQGQLFISWTPFGRCQNADIARSTYYVSIDIGQQNVFDIEIPFVYPVDYMMCSQQTHGFLQVWVQNALVAPQNVSTTVYVNVYMAAGDDFEFSVQQDPTTAIYQAASSSGLGLAEVWKPLGEMKQKKISRMDGHDDIDVVLKRPSQSRRWTCSGAASSDAYLIAELPYIDRLEINNWPCRALMCSGGVRWRIVTDLAITVPINFYVQMEYRDFTGAINLITAPSAINANDSAMRAGRHYYALQSTNERVQTFEIPMYSPMEYNSLYRLDDPLAPRPTARVYCVSNAGFGFHAVVYWSAADDFRLHWPIQVPSRTLVAAREKRETDDIVPLSSPEAQIDGKTNDDPVVMQGPIDFFMTLYDELTSYFSAIKETIQGGWDALLRGLESTKQFLCDTKDTVSWFAAIKHVIEFVTNQLLPTILAIYVAWKEQGPMQYIALAHLTKMVYNFASSEKLKEKTEQVTKMQGTHTQEEVVTDIVSSGCRNMVSWLLRSCGKDDGKDYQLYISRVTKHLKKDTFTYCLYVIKHTIEYMWYGQSANVEWVRNKQQTLIDIVEKYNEMRVKQSFIGSNLHNKNLKGETNFDILKGFFEAAQKALLDANDAPIMPSLASSIESMRNVYYETCRVANLKQSMPEPLGVYLVGKPGVGKSYITSVVLPALLSAKGVIKQRSNPTFPIPRGEQDTYWNNYDGQEIIILDDALQERDGSDPMTIINFVSTVRPAIPAASLDKKGLTYEGRILLATSNISNWNTVNNIIDIDALTRRFPLSYKLQLKEKFCDDKTGCFNVTKFVRELKELSKDDGDLTQESMIKIVQLVDDVWTFLPWDLSTGREASDVGVSFSVFLNAMISNLEGRDTNFVEASTTFNRFVRMQGDSDDETESVCSSVYYEDASDIRIRLTRPDNIEDGGKYSFKTMMQNDDVPTHYEDTGNYVAGSSHVGLMPMRPNKIDAYKASKHEFIVMGPTVAGKEKLSDPVRAAIKQEFDSISDQYSKEIDPDECMCKTYAGLISLMFNSYPGLKDVWSKTGFEGLCTEENVMILDKIWKTTMCPQSKKNKRWLGLMKYLILAGLATGAIYLAIKGCLSMFEKLIPTLQSYTGDNSLAHLKARGRNITVPNAVTRAVMQDQNGYSPVQERIHKNMIIIESTNFTASKHITVSALCLDDHTILCNQHLIDKILRSEDEVSAHIIKKEGVVPVKIERLNVRNVPINGEKSDLCMIRTYNAIHGMASIWHFIPNDANFMVGRQQEAYLKGGENTIRNSDDIDCVVTGMTKFNGAVGYYLQSQASEPTQQGDCGRPYILSNIGYKTPLLGLHACLQESTVVTGMVPFHYDSLKKVSDTLIAGYVGKFKSRGTIIHLEKEKVDVQCKEASNKFWHSLTPLNTDLVVNNVALKNNVPTETNLRRLTYRGKFVKHPEWECDMKPAALRGNGLVHPLITNSQKYDSVARHGTLIGDHNLVYDHYVDKFVDKGIPRIYTLDEAINGNDIMNPIQYRTGCGYWRLFGFKDGKKDFFKDLPLEDDGKLKREYSDKAKQHVVPIWNASFVERLEKCEEMAKKGNIFQTYWISTNKDEVRPTAKVEACKTRVFEQPGLEYTILVRKYFGAFLTYMKTRPGFTLYHGIGADKETVWKNYYDIFISHSDVGHAFDYKNFDGSVNQDAFRFFEEVVMNFYSNGTQEEHNVRAVLLRILRDGSHIMGSYSFESMQGNKSGNPFTDVFNSVCNYYIMAMAYCVGLRVSGQKSTMAQFDRDVKMLTYGDDIIMTVKRDALDYFNGPLIRDIVGMYGYTLTDAEKSDDMNYCTSVEKLTFLKSAFKVEGDVVLAPIPKEHIYKELVYAPKTCIGDELDLQQRIANTLRLMVHHGEEEFDKFKAQLRDRLIPRAWMSISYHTMLGEIAEKQLNSAIY
jgi:hypothetical protein